MMKTFSWYTTLTVQVEGADNKGWWKPDQVCLRRSPIDINWRHPDRGNTHNTESQYMKVKAIHIEKCISLSSDSVWKSFCQALVSRHGVHHGSLTTKFLHYFQQLFKYKPFRKTIQCSAENIQFFLTNPIKSDIINLETWRWYQRLLPKTHQTV